jgi:predicted naringenin-chalcone synthase
MLCRDQGAEAGTHIVRSDANAGVLMVNLELCTLHLQETQELEQVLSFLVFAALVPLREVCTGGLLESLG